LAPIWRSSTRSLETESIPDLFARLEVRKLLVRIDKNVLPMAAEIGEV
jgi:hypothetical protein